MIELGDRAEALVLAIEDDRSRGENEEAEQDAKDLGVQRGVELRAGEGTDDAGDTEGKGRFGRLTVGELSGAQVGQRADDTGGNKGGAGGAGDGAGPDIEEHKQGDGHKDTAGTDGGDAGPAHEGDENQEDDDGGGHRGQSPVQKTLNPKGVLNGLGKYSQPDTVPQVKEGKKRS